MIDLPPDLWQIDDEAHNRGWRVSPLGELLDKSEEWIYLNQLETYKEITVRLWGRGVVLRGQRNGSELSGNRRLRVRTNQFILSRIDARNGAFGLIPHELDGAVVSNDFPVYNVIEDKLLPEYLGWLCRTKPFIEACEQASEGTTNRIRLQEEKFVSIRIPLPPVSEQRQIIERLGRFNHLISEIRNLRKIISKSVDVFWPTILQDVLKGKRLSAHIRFKKDATQMLRDSAIQYQTEKIENYNNAHPGNPAIIDHGPLELPNGWIWTTLGSVLIQLVDCINDTPVFVDHNTSFIGLKSTNIKPYRLDLKELWFVTEEDFQYWNRREAPQPGDIILTREAPMGHACILPSGYNVCLTQRLMLLLPNELVILPDLLLHYLNSPYFHEQVDDVCRGLTTPHIRVKDAPNFLIPLPPMEIQVIIVDKLRSIYITIEKLMDVQNNTSVEIEALFQSTLHNTLSGYV